MELLRLEFPTVENVELDGYNISYPEGSGMAWKMFKSTPHILRRIKEERAELEQLVDKLQLDAVISDNRFGLYTDKIPSIYMTHQVMIKAPFFEPFLYRIHANYMQKFSEVWVPDFEESGLSGDLSHKYPLPTNAKYIGALSRFELKDSIEDLDVLVILSGPEPQRTRFENIVLTQLEKFKGSAMAILGTPDKQIDRLDKAGHRIVSHLNVEQLQQEISRSKLVISRSGYSTIMDLSALGKQAAFVPTSGQTEQEYLARKFADEGLHMMMPQRQFSVSNAWESREHFAGFNMRSGNGYREALNQLVATLS
jgi:UDP-N-acetylglucosamine transferase subunit ALG13